MSTPDTPEQGAAPTRRSLREAEAAAAAAAAAAEAGAQDGEARIAGTPVGGDAAVSPESPVNETGPLAFFTRAAQGEEAPVESTGAREHSADTTKPKPRRKTSVVGVLGELLLTAGVLVLLFIGWQIWWHTGVVASSQNSAGQDLSRQYSQLPEPTDPLEPDADGSYGDPVIGTAPVADGEAFGVLWVPRFGDDWSRVIAQGTSREAVLDHPELGVGHYDGTAMPAEVGNFAIAAHRDGWGNTFEHINQLQLGDEVVVETEDGWYTYVFRNLEYVQPTGVGVLYPVPQVPEFAAEDRILTMTSCNPLYTAAERIIAYAVFDSWQPRSAGPPASIAAEVAAADSAAEGAS